MVRFPPTDLARCRWRLPVRTSSHELPGHRGGLPERAPRTAERPGAHCTRQQAQLLVEGKATESCRVQVLTGPRPGHSPCSQVQTHTPSLPHPLPRHPLIHAQNRRHADTAASTMTSTQTCGVRGGAHSSICHLATSRLFRTPSGSQAHSPLSSLTRLLSRWL